MSEKAKETLDKMAQALNELSPEKLEYFSGFADGVAAVTVKAEIIPPEKKETPREKEA
jgi:hypothetical protein